LVAAQVPLVGQVEQQPLDGEGIYPVDEEVALAQVAEVLNCEFEQHQAVGFGDDVG